MFNMPAPLCETKSCLHNTPCSVCVAEVSENIHKGWDCIQAAPSFGNAQLFLWMFGICSVFVSVCRSGFVYFPLCSGIPSSPHPSRPPIYLASLQRPYTQHASQSHLEFFTCSLLLLTTLFPFPSSLRQYKQWRDQKVRRGAKSLYRVSIWPLFRWAVHTTSHAENRHAGKHAHTVFQIRQPSYCKKPSHR